MPFSGHEKAAIFLRAIGEEAASEVLKGLDIKDVGKISTYMTSLKTVENSEIENVFQEVSDRVSKEEVPIGGGEYVKNILIKRLGENNAKRILEQASKDNALDSLKGIDSKTLSNFLMTEHPQTIALILCLREPGQAAEVLTSLPESLQGDVAMRIAALERIPAHAVEEIEEVLKGTLDVNKGKGRKVGGVGMMAEVLNQIERSKEQLILEKIEGQDSELADSIRQLMFVFEDMLKIDDRGIQMILKEVSTEDLSLALKTASESLKDKIFKNMSQRAAQMLKEDMEARGPAKVSEVEKAQQEIVSIARKLEEEGKIVIAGGSEEELVG